MDAMDTSVPHAGPRMCALWKEWFFSVFLREQKSETAILALALIAGSNSHTVGHDRKLYAVPRFKGKRNKQ